MFMRITWGKIASGRWNEFETVYKESIAGRNLPKGLKNRWLVRNQQEPDVGYFVTLWESQSAFDAYVKSGEREAAVSLLKPFFINQFTVSDCDVRSSESATV